MITLLFDIVQFLLSAIHVHFTDFLFAIVACTWIAIYHKCLVDSYGLDKYVIHDVLNRAYIVKIYNIDLSIGFWSASHFLCYLLVSSKHLDISYIFIMLIGGMLWEVVEDLIGYITRKKSFNKKHTRRDYNNKIHYTNWWSGSIGDIFYNMMGVFSGFVIRSFELYDVYYTLLALYIGCLWIIVAYVHMDNSKHKLKKSAKRSYKKNFKKLVSLSVLMTIICPLTVIDILG